jgi:serine/threonine protein phosphatase PrpC
VQYAREWNGRVEYLENLKRKFCSSNRGGEGGGGSRRTQKEGKEEKDEEEDIQSGTTTSILSASGTATKDDAESLGSSSGRILKVTTSKGAKNTNNDDDDDEIWEPFGAAAVKTPKTMDSIDDSDEVGVDDGIIDERHQRLRQLKKRGHECDERVRAIRDQVRRCFQEEEEADDDDDDDEENEDVSDEISVGNNASNCGNTLDKDDKNEDSTDDDDEEYTDEYYRAEAAHDRHLMSLLEASLRDAFLDLDAEILAEMRGDDSGRAKDANTPFGAGHDLNKLLESATSTGGGGKGGRDDYGCVGHLPKELGNGDATTLDDEDDTNDDDSNKPVIEADAGTTAVVVLLTPKWIVCANAGDSRAVYSRSGHRSVPLSYDHKPSDEAEERRIRNAGGYVAGGRVEADLAVSRGLGDYRFKELDVVASGAWGENREGGKGGASVRGRFDDAPMMRPSDQKVSPVPDIIVQNRDPKEDEFIVIACDGIWDVQTNQDCVKMVAEIFADGESDMGLVCEEVCFRILSI